MKKLGLARNGSGYLIPQGISFSVAVPSVSAATVWFLFSNATLTSLGKVPVTPQSLSI